MKHYSSRYNPLLNKLLHLHINVTSHESIIPLACLAYPLATLCAMCDFVFVVTSLVRGIVVGCRHESRIFEGIGLGAFRI